MPRRLPRDGAYAAPMLAEPLVRRVDHAAEPDVMRDVDRVMSLAFESSSRHDQLAWYARAQPDGIAACVEADGTIAAAGAAIAYRDAGFGWIGLIATHPDRERRGLATAVTTHLVGVLAAHGCAAVLDASAKGVAVYERMGFVHHGWSSAYVLPAGAPRRAPGARCRPVRPDDRRDVLAYDATRFGADRTVLLGSVLDAHPAVLVRDGGGGITGYAVARDGVLGPVVADGDDVLADLIASGVALRPDAEEWRITMPAGCNRAEVLEELGFEERRRLAHMRLGIHALPGRRHAVVGMVTAGFG
jgi:GNAT superfamily N-acetyltransferase